ncbi:MAG: type IX secretion system plug protein domain-containing protein [Flavobacteriaceae bacterium]
MIEKIVSLIIFFFIVNPVFTQLNNVKSIKVESNGNLNSNIVFYKNDIINISFDILGEKKSDYYYQVTHCDYQWNPSKISKLEYIDGFDDIRITNYVFSKNTFQSFTNFSFQIPNENLKIKIDGNYVIKIFDENYNEIYERKIIILNNLTNGLVNIRDLRKYWIHLTLKIFKLYFQIQIILYLIIIAITSLRLLKITI